MKVFLFGQVQFDGIRVVGGANSDREWTGTVE
jgi:hypothetical protein